MSDEAPEWLLDTATISYIQRGQEPWASRVLALTPARRLVPVVVVEEQMRGRLAQVRAAESRRDGQRMLLAYAWLAETASFFGAVCIVPFDRAALTQYEALRATHRGISAQDLVIAAVALARHAVLVTPNVAHFEGIPGLTVEDWAG